MSPGVFIFRELLGAVRGKAAGLILGMIGLLFAFLAIFSCFFVLGTSDGSSTGVSSSAKAVTCYISPKLSVDEVQGLYRGILARDDVAAVTYVFAAEISPDRPGGAFVVQPTDSGDVNALVEALRTLSGVTEVDAGGVTGEEIHLSTPIRIGLLIGLLVTGLASLLVGRIAFLELLRNFSPELNLLHLSGTPDWSVQAPVVWLGIAAGVVASLILIVVLYALHASALSGAAPAAAAGLLHQGRVLTAALLSLLLGIIMGGLCGGLGAGLLSSRFSDYS